MDNQQLRRGDNSEQRNSNDRKTNKYKPEKVRFTQNT